MPPRSILPWLRDAGPQQGTREAAGSQAAEFLINEGQKLIRNLPLTPANLFQQLSYVVQNADRSNEANNVQQFPQVTAESPVTLQPLVQPPTVGATAGVERLWAMEGSRLQAGWIWPSEGRAADWRADPLRRVGLPVLSTSTR